MNKLQELQQKYPGLYDKCFDFSIGPGWFNLIDCLSILAPKGTKVVQVKAKFGSLRFYVAFLGTPEFYGSINLAELLSERICERCGKPATLENNVVLCNECNKERKNE